MLALLSAALAAPICHTSAVRAGLDPGFGPTLSAPTLPRSGFVADTCWGQQAPRRVVVGRFAVEFEDGFDEGQATDFGEALNEAYEALVFDEGWTPIHGDDAYLLLAYIDPGTGGAAYTSVGACSGAVGWMPYIVATSDAFEDEDWWRDMAAHELNHAQQFSYEAGHEAWWWEATAVWAAEQVHPTHDTWIRYVDQGFSAQPWLAMRGSSQTDPDTFLHMYGMAIWAFFLEEHVDRDMVLATWEGASGAEEVDPLEQLDALGEDPDALLLDFLAANAAMDYNHREAMARAFAVQVHDALPAEGEDAGPEYLGQAFVGLPTTGYDEAAPNLRVRVQSDGAWTRALVGVRGGSVAKVLSFDEETTLEEPGSYDELWLAVSPRTNRRGRFPWSWSAEATDEAEGGASGTVDTPDGRGNTGTLPADTGRCATGPAGRGWALLALLLARRFSASSRPTPSRRSRG